VNELTSILLILAICVFLMVIRRATDRAGDRQNRRVVPTQRSRAWNDAAWKLNQTVEILRENLDPAKLRPGQERYIDYYIAYLYEVGRAICVHNEVEYSPMIQTPILAEVVRLCGGGDDELREGERKLNRILASEVGRHGADDGLADGAYAVDPGNPGPYWVHIAHYFES
jgi:hypothetical protein